MGYISDCCGAYMSGDMVDIGICPDCGEHCEVVDEELICSVCGEERDVLNDNGVCDECEQKQLTTNKE